MGGSNHEITELLQAWSGGDVEARDRLSEALGVSVATVERDWQAGRAWLLKTLAPPR